MARKKRQTKIGNRIARNVKQATNNQFLLVSIVVAVLLVGLFIGAATTRSAPATSGEKVAKYTSPAEIVKATEPQQAEPATQAIPVPTPVPAVSEKLPDLQVQVFSTYSGETKQAIRITTDTFNKGDADITTGYKVTYGYETKIGTNRLDYITVGNYEVKGTHKAGQTRTFAFLWVPETAGTYDFKICADAESLVKEGNEENNCAKSTITVKVYGKYA